MLTNLQNSLQTPPKSTQNTPKTLQNASNNRRVVFKGPRRMPTKKLRLMVRKSPCGEGTNTYDRFQMRIHKRVIENYTSANLIKQIASIAMEPGVSIDMKVEDYHKNIKTVTNSVNKQFKPEYKKADVLRK